MSWEDSDLWYPDSESDFCGGFSSACYKDTATDVDTSKLDEPSTDNTLLNDQNIITQIVQLDYIKDYLNATDGQPVIVRAISYAIDELSTRISRLDLPCGSAQKKAFVLTK